MIKVNDGSGHWVDSDGNLMTTVYTSNGWMNLSGSYEVVSHDDDAVDGLTCTILVNGEQVRVQNADFEDCGECSNDGELGQTVNLVALPE